MRIRQLESEKIKMDHRGLAAPASVGADSRPPAKSEGAAAKLREEEEKRETEISRRVAEEVEAMEEVWKERLRQQDLQWQVKLDELKEHFEADSVRMREECDRRIEETKERLADSHLSELHQVEAQCWQQCEERMTAERLVQEEAVRSIHESYRVKEEEESQILREAIEQYSACVQDVEEECDVLLASCRSEMDICECLDGVTPWMREVFHIGLIQLWVLDEDDSSYHCMYVSSQDSNKRNGDGKAVCSVEIDQMMSTIADKAATQAKLSSRADAGSWARKERVCKILPDNKVMFDAVTEVVSLPFRKKGQAAIAIGRRQALSPTALSSIYCATLSDTIVQTQGDEVNLPTGVIFIGEERSPTDNSVDSSDIAIVSRYVQWHRASALLQVIRKIRCAVSGSYGTLHASHAVDQEKSLRAEMEMELQVQYAVGRLKDKLRIESLNVQSTIDSSSFQAVELAAISLANACVHVLECTEAWTVLDMQLEGYDGSEGTHEYIVMSSLDSLQATLVEESPRSSKPSLYDLVRCGGISSGVALPKPALISTTRTQLRSVGLTLPAHQKDRTLALDASDESIQVMIVPFSADMSHLNCSAVVLQLPDHPLIHQEYMLKYVDALAAGFCEGFIHMRKVIAQSLHSAVEKTLTLISLKIGHNGRNYGEGDESMESDTAIVMTAASDEGIANLLGAEKGYLLVSGEVLGVSSSSVQSEYFIMCDDDKVNVRRVPINVSHSNRWLDTLSGGKHIVMASMADGRRDRQELSDFLGQIHSDIRSVVLIPVNTSRGLCIFCLVNKLYTGGEGVSFDDPRRRSMERLANMMFPSLSDVAEIVMRSPFREAVRGFIESACNRNVSASNDKKMIAQLESAVAKYSQRLVLLDTKCTMSSTFQRWRIYCCQKSTRAGASRISTFSIAIKKLLDMSTCSPLSADRFQQEVETCLHLLFPNDILIVSDTGASERGNRLLKGAQSESRGGAEPSQLRRTLTCLKHGTLIGCVNLIRAKSNDIFDEDEVGMLDSMCQLAEISYVYTLRPEVQVSASQTEEHVTEVVKYVSSPVIPFLLNTLPLLFSSSGLLVQGDNRSNEEAERIMDESYIASIVVKWVKTMCKADVVLLRVKPADSSAQEMLISSEDSHSNAPAPASPDDASLRDLVMETSSGSSQMQAESNQVVMKLLGINGELKLIGTRECRDGNFCEDAGSIAAAASYLLVASTLLRRKHVKFIDDVTAAHSAIADMEALVEECQAQTDTEIRKSENLALRIGFIRRLAEFSAELLCCRHVTEFSDLIWSSFPRAFRVKAASLFIRTSGAENSDFVTVLPTSVSMGSQDTDFEEKLSWSQLKKIPLYDRNLTTTRIAPSRRGKILIIHTETRDVVGAILVLQEASKTDDSSHPECDATEDLFLQIVSSYISRMLAVQEFENDVGRNKVPLEKFELLQQEKAALIDDLESNQHELNGLIEELSRSKLDREQLGNKLKTLTAEYSSENARTTSRCDQLENSLKVMEDEFELRLQKLNSQYVSECTRGEDLSNAIHQLESMVIGFAVDTRLQPQHLLGWMYEFADKFGAQVHAIHRSVGGELVIPSGGASGIATAICGTAADAIRDCKPVEVVVSLAEVHSSVSMRSGASSVGHVHNPAVILCIPNRLSSGSNAKEYNMSLDSSETVCYAFVRHGDRKFSSFEKSFMACVTGLTAKTIAVYESAKQKYPENIERMLAVASAESVDVARLKNAVAYATRQWSSPVNSWNELVAAAELGGRAILSFSPPSTSPTDDIFVVECCVWQPGSKSPIFTSQRRSTNSKFPGLIQSSFENDIVAHRVMSNGRSHRNGNTMWIPLKTNSGEVIALVYAERKIDFRRMPPLHSVDEHERTVDVRSSAQERSKSHFISHSPDEMVFSEIEEEMMNIFTSMAAGAINSLIHQQETLQSVQKASAAILALQSTQASLESKLAQEVALKLKYEEGLKMGSDIMSSVIIKRYRNSFMSLIILRFFVDVFRMDMSVLLDVVRKSLATLVSCKECFIITPFSPTEASIPDHRNDQNNMYTLASESGATVEVSLEPMDIEYVALKSRRPCKSSGLGDHQSWAARNCAMEKWSSPADTTEPKEDTILYSLAIPCGLRNGSTVIVVALRYNYEFDSSDEMCIFWLTKILSCSIDMHQDESDTRHFRKQLENAQNELAYTRERCEEIREQLSQRLDQALQRDHEEEIFSLRKGVERLTYEAKESLKLTSVDVLPYDLDQMIASSFHTPSGVDLIAHCAEIAFRHTNVEVWSSGETSTRVREMDALLLDTKERTNRDHMTVGNWKIVVWEENAVGFDGLGAGIYVKAVITNPDLSELPVWVKIRKHEDEFPEIYKIKILFMLRMVFERTVHRNQMKQVIERIESSKDEVIMSHKQEVESLQLEINKHVSTLHDSREEFDILVLNLKMQHDEELGASISKYKSAVRDVLKDRLVLSEYFTKVAVAERFVLSCGSISRSEDKMIPKKMNISKMIRKLCEVVNHDGILDVAAAFVKRVASATSHRSGKGRAPIETTHLTWISPSTHWVGTSSPLTSDSPIGAAYLSKRIVYTAVSDESAAKAILVDSNNPKIEVNPSDYMSFVSDALPELTLIVPVTFPHQDEEYLIVVKPVVQANGSMSVMCPLSVNLSIWATLRTCLTTAANLNFTVYADAKQRKLGALCTVLRGYDLRISVSRLRELSRAFASLKATWMMDRLSAYSFDDHKYAMARKHIRVLERSVADWTELVKGVNGASGGIAQGLRGLWGQACRPLMSMITSHVTLRGCGLMVAGEDGEVMDLNVEALSAVDEAPQSYSDENDFTATVSIRPASDLSSSLHNLALNILNGQTVVSDSGSVQRLWKLSRSEGAGMRYGVHEQMWLVPLRTATEVLGIVRVFVDVSSDVSRNEGANKYNYDEFQDYSEESSTEYGWGGGGAESAKRNLINFAEVLAPMVTATRLIDVSQTRERECEADVEEHEHREALLRKEVDTLARRLRVVVRCVDEVHRAAVQTIHGEECNIEILEVLRRRLDMPLSVVLNVEVKILMGDIRQEELRRMDSSGRIHIVNIVGTDDRVVGYIRAFVPHSSLDNAENHDESVMGAVDAPVNITDSFTTLRQPQQLIDYVTVTTALEVVACCISGTFAALEREMEAKEKVTKAVENLHEMQHELDDQIQLRQDFSFREIMSSEKSAFNLQVANIMRSCAICESSFSWEEAEMQLIAQEVNQDRSGDQHRVGLALESLLKSLCGDLSSLFKENCVFNMGVAKRVSVLEDSSDDMQQGRSGEGQLTWFSSEGYGNLTFPEGIHVGNDSIRILEDLAAACFSQNKKSCVDIEIDRQRVSVDIPEAVGMKVLSYPLRPPLIEGIPSTAVGILQVLMPLSIDKSEVEALCDAISQAVAGVIRNDRARVKLLHRVRDFSAANSILSNTLQESSDEAQSWRKRFTAWNAVALSLKGLAQDCQESSEGIYKLLPTDMRGMLKSYGITISASRGEEYDSDDSGVSQSGESGHSFVLRSDPCSNTAEILVVCNFNDEMIPAEDHEPLFEVIREYISCLHVFIVAQKRLVVDNEEVVAQLNDKIKAIQHDCVLSNDQCRILSEKLHIASRAVNDQANRIVSIKGRIPRAVEAVLRPLSGDICSLLQWESDKHMKGFELSATVLDTFFGNFSVVISKSVGRVISNRARPFHASVLVKAVSTEKSGRSRYIGSGIVVFEKSQATGTTFSDSEFSEENEADTARDSCLYRCFTTEAAQTVVCPGQVYSLSPYDLIGISAQQLTSLNIVDKQTSKLKAALSTVIAVPLNTDMVGLTAVVRVIFAEEQRGRSTEGSGTLEVDDSPRVVVQSLVDTLCALSRSVARVFCERQRCSHLEEEVSRIRQQLTENVEGVQHQLAKYRKIYRVVCREMSALFDPPVIDMSVNGVLQKLPSHPAALSPLVALQDTCLKTLAIVRSIAQSEGQAILLKDPDSTANTYQIMYTGNSLSWPGIDAGTFGMISSPTTTVSLAGTCMKAHKAMIVTNAKAERTYVPRIDGECAENTPLLLVPVRGRSSGVVGVLIIARGSEGRVFAAEDAVAVELAASFSSLSLFWSSGLGYIHNKLSSSVAKIEELEKSVMSIKNPSKRR